MCTGDACLMNTDLTKFHYNEHLKLISSFHIASKKFDMMRGKNLLCLDITAG